MEKKYYVYHVKGIKVGCTSEYPKRVIDQGFNPSDCEILYELDDIYEASDLEIKEQKKRKYRVDNIPYWKAIKNRETGGVKGGIIAGNLAKETGQVKRMGQKYGQIAKETGRLSEMGRKGGLKAGQIAKESGRLRELGFIGGNIAKETGQIGNLGKAQCAIERTCPHCGVTKKGPVYFRSHGDRCSLKNK
jgi:hypothetical protein